MSGGSYDYLYFRIEEFANQCVERERNNPLRKAFADHLHLVAKAMHDIEWVDSGDYGADSADESMRNVLGDATNQKVAQVLIERAEKLITQLQASVKALKEAA